MARVNFLYFVLVFGLTAKVLAKDPKINRYDGIGPDVLCVYPVDGQYTFLQRLLFYILMTFGVLARRRKWLVVGALTTAMSYSAAAAIHAMLLVSSPGRDYVDLNIYAIYSVTSAGIILSVLLLVWSTTLGKVGRRLRYIVLLWFALVVVGSFFAIGIMFARENHSGPPPCLNPETVDAPAASLFPSETEDCTYVCLPQGGLFHTEDQILAWPNRISATSDITAIYFPTAASYILTFVIIAIVTHIRQRRRNDQKFQHPNVPVIQLDSKPRINLTLKEKFQKWWSHRSEAMTPVRSLEFPTKTQYPKFWAACEYYACFALFGAVAANTIMNEVRMYGFPTNEDPQEVGQWAPWVAVGLVVLAQVINKYAKLRWGERGTDDEERGFDRIRQNLEASMARRGWIAPRQLMSDTDDDLALSRAESWESKRRYSL